MWNVRSNNYRKLRKARFERDTQIETTYKTKWIRNGGKFYLATPEDVGEVLVD